jgi:hypothetical protein
MILTFYNVVLFCLALVECFSGHFEMSRRQFVASMTALCSHKFSNLKFEGDAAQAECAARVENGFLSGRQQNS